MTPTTLRTIAPSVTFHPVSDTSAATAPNAQAKDSAVNYAGTLTSYAVGTLSEAGTAYGVVVDKQGDAKTYYLNGEQVPAWEQASTGCRQRRLSHNHHPSDAADHHGDLAPQVGPISAASDAEAMMLLRNAMTTIESAYASVNTFEPSVPDSQPAAADGALHHLRDPRQRAKRPLRPSPSPETRPWTSTAAPPPTLWAPPQSQAPPSERWSDGGAGGQTTTYYVNGQVEDWSIQLPTSVIGSLFPHRG